MKTTVAPETSLSNIALVMQMTWNKSATAMFRQENTQTHKQTHEDFRMLSSTGKMLKVMCLLFISSKLYVLTFTTCGST